MESDSESGTIETETDDSSVPPQPVPTVKETKKALSIVLAFVECCSEADHAVDKTLWLKDFVQNKCSMMQTILKDLFPTK